MLPTWKENYAIYLHHLRKSWPYPYVLVMVSLHRNHGWTSASANAEAYNDTFGTGSVIEGTVILLICAFVIKMQGTVCMLL